MKKIDELKKKAKENKSTLIATAGLVACVGGYVGILIWEHRAFKTIPVKEWQKMTGSSTFDDLLDKPIVGAFATVEYEDGTIGVIRSVTEVAEKIGKEGFKI